MTALRQKVAALRAGRAGWPALPPEAKVYHQKLRRLDDRLAELDGSFFLRAAEVEEQREAWQRLERLAVLLEALFRDRSEVEQLLAKLDFPLLDCPAPVAARLRRRQEAWRAALRGIGEEARDADDARADRAGLERLRGEVAALADTLAVFTEARQLAERWRSRGGELDGEHYARRLAELADGPAGLAECRELGFELRRAVERLRELEVTVAAPADSHLDDLILELHTWAPLLPETSQGVGRVLAAKVAYEAAGAPGGPGAADLAGLKAEAEELLRSVEALAAERRQARRRDLERRLAALARIAPQDDLQLALSRLADRAVGSAGAHQRWLEDWTAIDGPLRNRAHNEQDRLAARLDEVLVAVAERLVLLGSRPLGREAAAAVLQLGEERRQLAATAGVERRLDALVRLETMVDELDRLAGSSAEQVRLLRENEALLLARQERLAELGRELGRPPAAAAAAGEAAVEPRDLDAAQAAGEERAGRQAVAENLFLGWCLEQREELERQLRRREAALDQAALLGLVAPAAAEEVLAEPAGPVEGAAAALRRARATAELQERRLALALAAARERLAAEVAAIAELEADGRALASPLIWTELDAERERLAAEWAAVPAPPAGAAPGAAPLAAFEVLLAHLRHFAEQLEWSESRRRNARARGGELAARLRELERRRLTGHCPRRWLDRAYALVAGLAAAEAAGALDIQLAAAESWLLGLERHAQRRVQALALEEAR